jgi:hypothetical protein
MMGQYRRSCPETGKPCDANCKSGSCAHRDAAATCSEQAPPIRNRPNPHTFYSREPDPWFDTLTPKLDGVVHPAPSFFVLRLTGLGRWAAMASA